jgi:hypothetical protein
MLFVLPHGQLPCRRTCFPWIRFYIASMSRAETTKKLEPWLKLEPVPGQPSVYIVREDETAPPGGEMTDEDWDKFERDVMEARAFAAKCG